MLGTWFRTREGVAGVVTAVGGNKTNQILEILSAAETRTTVYGGTKEPVTGPHKTTTLRFVERDTRFCAKTV